MRNVNPLFYKVLLAASPHVRREKPKMKEPPRVPIRSPYIGIQPQPICDPDRMREDRDGERLWDEGL